MHHMGELQAERRLPEASAIMLWVEVRANLTAGSHCYRSESPDWNGGDRTNLHEVNEQSALHQERLHTSAWKMRRAVR